MIFDHYNFIYNGHLTAVGRVAFPVFGYLIIYNYLFRAADKKQYIKRLFIFALISQVAFSLATQRYYMLNVMFLFSFVLLAINALESNKLFPAILILPLTLFCEFSIAGVLYMAGIYFYYKYQSKAFLLLSIFSMFIFIPPRFYIAIPFIHLLFYYKEVLDAIIPYKKSFKYLFYFFYPSHFIVLYLLHNLSL